MVRAMHGLEEGHGSGHNKGLLTARAPVTSNRNSLTALTNGGGRRSRPRRQDRAWGLDSGPAGHGMWLGWSWDAAT